MRLNRSLCRRESKRRAKQPTSVPALGGIARKLNAVCGQFEGLAAGSVVAESAGLRVGDERFVLVWDFAVFLTAVFERRAVVRGLPP